MSVVEKGRDLEREGDAVGSGVVTLTGQDRAEGAAEERAGSREKGSSGSGEWRRGKVNTGEPGAEESSTGRRPGSSHSHGEGRAVPPLR